MLAVQFGAGNIGRGFLGQLLFEAGYEICFMDVIPELVEKLNQEGTYTIHFLEEKQAPVYVTGVSAINNRDVEAVGEKIVSADLITTAVGAKNLKFIAPLLAGGIRLRLQRKASPLNIIACENAIHASDMLKHEIWSHLSREEQQAASQVIGFPNAAVDRIVTKGTESLDLDVTVESFYEWDVDRNGVKGDLLPVPGIHYTDRLEAYIERKLFVVNAMHASMAYLGYLKGLKTTAEASNDPEIMTIVRDVGQDSGKLLEKKYNIPLAETAKFQECILKRFANPLVSDPLLRVGRSPVRKLSAGERLVSPYVQLSQYGIQFIALAKVIAAAMHFAPATDPEAVELQDFLSTHPVEEALEHFTGIQATSLSGQAVLCAYKELNA